MSILGRNLRFLAGPIGFAPLARGKIGWIRKPPFYPLNYGNKQFRILDFGLRILARNASRVNHTLRESSQQRHKPAAAGDFELAEDRVEMLFHHR
jgi:hypothetical protein